MTFAATIVQAQDIAALARRMHGWQAVVLDCETTGLDLYLGDKVLGIGVGDLAGDDEYYYVPLNHPEAPKPTARQLQPLIEVLQAKPLVGQDIKFDLHCLHQHGWQAQQPAYFDIIVAGRLNSREQFPDLDLESQARDILGYQYVYEDVKRQRKRMSKLPLERVGPYCCEDVHVTKHLYRWHKEHMSDELLALFARESRLTRDLFDIEARGTLVDADYVELACKRLDKEIGKLERALYKANGGEFNLGSPPQKAAFMEKMGAPVVKRSPKTSAPSWDRDALRQVALQHPQALQLAKRNALTYQRNGMVERCVQAVERGGGVLHHEIKNWGTVTGRCSGNSQQMPDGWLQFSGVDPTAEDLLVWAAGEEAHERLFSIRKLLRPREGNVMFSLDYRQIEMYVLGFYIKDPTFTRWLDSGNVHAAVAQEIWGDEVKYYKRGKVYNFATIYGQGDKARALALGCTVAQSAEYREQYAQRIPGYGKFFRRLRRLLYSEGHVDNIYNRQYWLEPHLAYKAVNYLVQGSSGDFVKFKLPETRDLRQHLQIAVLNTTHDDFAIELPRDQACNIDEFMAALRISPFGRELGIDAKWSHTSLVDMEDWHGAAEAA